MDYPGNHYKTDNFSGKIGDAHGMVSLLDGAGPSPSPGAVSAAMTSSSPPGSVKRSSVTRGGPFVTAGERGERDTTSRMSMSMTFPGSPGFQASLRRTEQRLEEQSAQLAELTKRMTSMQSAQTLSHFLQEHGGGVIEHDLQGEYDIDDSFLMMTPAPEEKEVQHISLPVSSTTAATTRTTKDVSAFHASSSSSSSRNHNYNHSNNHNHNHNSNNHHHHPVTHHHPSNDGSNPAIIRESQSHETMKTGGSIVAEAKGVDEAKGSEYPRSGGGNMEDRGQGGRQSRGVEANFTDDEEEEAEDVDQDQPLGMFRDDGPSGGAMTGGEISRASEAAAMAIASAQSAIYGGSTSTTGNHQRLLIGVDVDVGGGGGGLGSGDGHVGNVFVDITEIYSMGEGNNNNNHNNNNHSIINNQKDNNQNDQNIHHFPSVLSPGRAGGGRETGLGGEGSAASSPYSLSRPNSHHPHHLPNNDESFSSVNPLHRRQHQHTTEGKPTTTTTTPLSQQKSNRSQSGQYQQFREPSYQGKRRAVGVGSNGNLASSFLMSTHDRLVART